MRIVSVKVKDFGPISELEFNPSNNYAIIGANGKGKTWLLNLLATLAGTRVSTDIYGGQSIGEARITIQVCPNSAQETLHLRGNLDVDLIDEFKSRIGEDNLLSYGLPEDRMDYFSNGSCDLATLHALIDDFFDERIRVRQDSKKARLSVYLGDGHRHALRLLSLLSVPNIPVLLDMPETHLDLIAMRRMALLFKKAQQQIIYVTHSPEMLAINNFDKGVLTM